MKNTLFTAFAILGFAVLPVIAEDDIALFDPNMSVENAVVTNGVKWIDGRYLPIEGRAFDDVANY